MPKVGKFHRASLQPFSLFFHSIDLVVVTSVRLVTTTITTMESGNTATATPTTSAYSNGGDKRTGGIAWGGSLVGSENPNNLGYRYSNPLKRFRRAGDDDEEDGENGGKKQLPTNVVVQFQNRQGEELANNLDIPTNSSLDD